MAKKRKIDFVLEENDGEKLIFRFYPKKSTCHSFDKNPPKTWNDVYKVYYSYAIFRSYSDDTHIDMLFNCLCDECSIIDEVSRRIGLILQGINEVKGSFSGRKYTVKLIDNEIEPFGYGVIWNISECRNPGGKEEKYYRITLWDYDDTGFRFTISKEKLKEFGEYLNECCEHMLSNGCPI